MALLFFILLERLGYIPIIISLVDNNSLGGRRSGTAQYPIPKRRQENNGEFINHIMVSHCFELN